MAKRRRLEVSAFGTEVTNSAISEPKVSRMSGPGLSGAGSAPIARVAGDAATAAALDAVSEELHRARAEGRLVQTLPLAAIQDDYLVRDRILAEDEDFAALMASLRARGQQAPIDVVSLGEGRFGLISGWRRLTALRLLLTETGDARFGTVQALLRRPADATDAYVAMVEENEIRLGLSYYERARIVFKLVDQAVYETSQKALQSLFSTASRAKRSKIGSFIGIVAALDGVLQHPARIPERLGLTLAHALAADSGLAVRIADRLRRLGTLDAEAELALLAALVAEGARPEPVSRAKLQPESPGVAEWSEEVVPGIHLRIEKGHYILSGPGVDAAFGERLVAWLQSGSRTNP
jgi:ParB family transcriptional regulator, chromosome partitioning protein